MFNNLDAATAKKILKAEAKITRMKVLLNEISKSMPPHSWECGLYDEQLGYCNCLNARIRKEIQ
jgi:hypothetical protein